jgi:hypothetical protein
MGADAPIDPAYGQGSHYQLGNGPESASFHAIIRSLVSVRPRIRPFFAQ